MKKLFVALCLVILMAVNAFPAELTMYSGEKSADALIHTGEGLFKGILVATDGTNAVTVSIYDAASATGSEIVPTLVIPTSAAYRSQAIYVPYPVKYYTGLYVDITCAGPVGFEVYYEPR
jgi:hypothetical protein